MVHVSCCIVTGDASRQITNQRSTTNTNREQVTNTDLQFELRGSISTEVALTFDLGSQTEGGGSEEVFGKDSTVHSIVRRKDGEAKTKGRGCFPAYSEA